MSEVYQWDTTAANNNDPPPDGWPEDQAYNTVNNCAREMMAAEARDLADRNGTLSTTGTAPAYALASNRTITALVDGLIMGFTAHAPNSAAATTLNLNGLGAQSVTLPDGSNPDFNTNGVYLVVWDASQTRWQLLSATVPEAAVPPVTTVNSSRDLTTADLGGPILRIGGPITLTIPAAFGAGTGTRVRIINPDGFTFYIQNDSGVNVYRTDFNSPFVPNPIPLTEPGYTLIFFSDVLLTDVLA